MCTPSTWRHGSADRLVSIGRASPPWMAATPDALGQSLPCEKGAAMLPCQLLSKRVA